MENGMESKNPKVLKKSRKRMVDKEHSLFEQNLWKVDEDNIDGECFPFEWTV
jgi:hypothetical protein